MDIDKISLLNLQLAAMAIERNCDKALSEWKAFRDASSLKTAADRERMAYLHGVLHGTYQSVREFEMRTPIEWTGS